jgi:ferric-dicitrate binding protein FerR (iron transport regulator)
MKNTKTNTEITNVNNNTNKEETTMKNTRTNINNTNKEETTMKNTAKRNSKITRKFAAMLAAVMAMTTMATIGASASTDDVIKMNTRSAVARSASTSFTEDTKITVDEDTKMIVDLTSKTLFTIINECTPYGKFVTPAL